MIGQNGNKMSPLFNDDLILVDSNVNLNPSRKN